MNTDFPAIQRLADEWIRGVNRFDRNGEALFVAKQADTPAESLRDRLIGGSRFEYRTRLLPSATIGRVRHLYVMLEHRRRGIGRDEC
jgi:GNAT superfamily N-acetyltransferase